MRHFNQQWPDKYNLYRNVELFCCYRDRAKYIPSPVERNQLTENLEIVEPALIAVELLIVFQHSNHIQIFTEDAVDKGLVREPCVHKDIAGLYPGLSVLWIIAMAASGLWQTASRRHL